jgi:Protein of unknown function (DUF2442)
MLSVIAVEYLDAFQLQCVFNNGCVKEIDFVRHWDKLSGPIFQPLRDPVFFAHVTLPPDSETIEWPNGADLAAEFLYKIGKTVTVPHHEYRVPAMAS